LIVTGKLEEAKTILDEGKKRLDDYMGIMEAVIHAHYYKASFEYHKEKGDAQEHFKNAMLYLTYTTLEGISRQEQVQLASDVGLAALLGKNIYNFGELLQHPIIKVLSEVKESKEGKEANAWGWLPDLLNAFNKGDIQAFKMLLEAHRAKQPILNKNIAFLNEKVRIMALIDMVFTRPSNQRRIEFKEICSRCDLRKPDVEIILMKAFSLKVIKGVIDEVEECVRVTWVQPRVLDLKQISQVRDSLKEWSKGIHQTTLFLEEHSPELLTHSRHI